jgi:hypothetical protein
MFMACNAKKAVKSSPTFRENILPSSSWLKTKRSKKQQLVGFSHNVRFCPEYEGRQYALCTPALHCRSHCSLSVRPLDCNTHWNCTVFSCRLDVCIMPVYKYFSVVLFCGQEVKKLESDVFVLIDYNT